MEIELKYRVDDRNKSEEIWHDDYLASIEEEDSRNKVKMQSLYFDTGLVTSARLSDVAPGERLPTVADYWQGAEE